ncbi:MAG: hypothetical protein CM1200mP2_11160 [Planctomycetaceae bacterium]|nr:MAG: hypothetical protein CM1200mP2_11160 [Planctomycetaceae bacterium]
MDQIPRQRRPSLSIELSPLIDCVFLLLIFFMLSSTMLAPAIDLDLPDAAMASEVQAPEVVVPLTAGGKCCSMLGGSTWRNSGATCSVGVRIPSQGGDLSRRRTFGPRDVCRVLEAARAPVRNMSTWHMNSSTNRGSAAGRGRGRCHELIAPGAADTMTVSRPTVTCERDDVRFHIHFRGFELPQISEKCCR